MTYFVTLFEQIDCLLCAVFGGGRDMTISLAAARAEARGEGWGCILCWWLHQTLRQAHCRRTLVGEPMSGFANASAAVQIGLLFAAIFYGIPLAVSAIF